MDNTKRFDSVLYAVPESIKNILFSCPDSVKQKTEEIRLRVGLPIALTVAGETVYLRENGDVCLYFSKDLPIASKEEINESFKKLCESSVYAHENELKQGFIVMKNGCRAGVFGTLSENGFMQEISSVNIRIAREVLGSANKIIENYSGGGLLIAGPPSSGKTTVLRDLCRQLSNGVLGKPLRVAVIDSRLEISGGIRTKRGCDLGKNTDVLITDDKAKGIEIAVRTMFPQIVAFDEIGNEKELESVAQSFFSGVNVITTAHISSKEELIKRSVTRKLILSGAVSDVAVLGSSCKGEIEMISVKELLCDRAV